MILSFSCDSGNGGENWPTPVISGARGTVFEDCPILQKPDNKHFALIRLYFMLFGFVKNCL